MGTKLVLLGGEDGAVRQARELANQLPELECAEARLAVLDEHRVLGQPGRIEKERHGVLPCQFAHGLEVVERERLPAGHVQTGFLADEGDPLRPDLVKDAFERDEVDVTLERERRRRIVRLRDRDVAPDAARKFDVGA